MSSKTGKKETLSKQSAAQFFSEHQQIAGFDNPGKSLFTTIREFVENSLDAAESMHVLPEIELCIEEFSETEHNALHGIRTNSSSNLNLVDMEDDTEEDPVPTTTKGKAKAAKDGAKEPKEQMYYLIRCTDNGCGIAEENIGDMLGRVLSGSKHGIRQTRGKFGLGAKMALIWSKKSSGLPIKIRTAHSANAATTPASVTSVTLDIDIYRNEPRILKKQSLPNAEGWRGTEIAVTISGHWGNYRSRVLQYFQQLAVITPYAKLAVDFKCHRDAKKSFRADFERRSEQMPPIAQEIDPHPKSLNNITLSNLLQAQSSTSSSLTIEKFLTTALSGITPTVAARITAALGISQKPAKSLQAAQVAALIQALRDEKQIKPPSAGCLSPAGEYNMRLGVLKELKPKMVATFSDKAGAHEGHPFLVEAAVSLGGTQVREGINVYRFANRIPLLFEAGADVVTQVATKRINWSSYHIDPKKDNIGVYVSIVSTKIPFKGTSKEYVGEDVTEIFQSVKRALQGCCQQLRVNLAKSLAQKEEAERRRTLVKYIPNITKSLFTVIEKMQDKQAAAGSSSSSKSTGDKTGGSGGGGSGNSGAAVGSEVLRVLLEVSKKSLTEQTLAECLQKAVDKFEFDSLLQSSLDRAVGEGSGKRRRLFICPEALLAANPLPSELVVTASESSGFSRTQSLASQAGSQPAPLVVPQCVDLTGGAELVVSPARGSRSVSAQPSPVPLTARTGAKRSYLGTFSSSGASLSAGPGRWVRLVLPTASATTTAAAATAGTGGAYAAVVVDVTGDGDDAEGTAPQVAKALPSAVTCYMLVEA